MKAACHRRRADAPGRRAEQRRDRLVVGRDALAAARRLGALELAHYTPEHDALYPAPGQPLREIAALIQAGPRSGRHDVFSEVAKRHLGLIDLTSILPGYGGGPELGLLA
jgi:hypothetical protein